MGNYAEQVQQIEKERIKSVCELISLNSDIVTSQIPWWVLKSCFFDESSAMRIFLHVLNLESNKEQKMQAISDEKILSSLFDSFRLVAEGIVYCHNFYLPREPFQIFRLENYSVLQLAKTGNIFVDYINFIKHNKKDEPPENDEQSLKLSIPFKSNHLPFMEWFINNLGYLRNLPLPINDVTMVIMKIVGTAISNINEPVSTEKYIKVVATQYSRKELELTISCAATAAELCQESNELYNLLPIDDDDLKKRRLSWIKDYARKIYFSGNGTEMTLTFSKKLKSRR